MTFIVDDKEKSDKNPCVELSLENIVLYVYISKSYFFPILILCSL